MLIHVSVMGNSRAIVVRPTIIRVCSGNGRPHRPKYTLEGKVLISTLHCLSVLSLYGLTKLTGLCECE